MAREDKIALTVISVIGAVVVLVLLYALRVLLQISGIVIDASSDGIGFRSAFFASLGISFVFMIIFAFFAGDGVIGELGIMLTGFFVMIVFFTVSIALIL